MLKLNTKRTATCTIQAGDGEFTANFEILTAEALGEIEYKPPGVLVTRVLKSVDGLQLENEDGTAVPDDQTVTLLAELPDFAKLVYDAYMDFWQKKALPKIWLVRLGIGQDSPTPTPATLAA